MSSRIEIHHQIPLGTPHRALVDRAIAVIDEHLSDETFQVDDLARHLAMSRSLLYLHMGRLGSPSPAALIRARRLDRAAEMLIAGGRSVTEVTWAVGFKSPSHFSQAFRERFGITPSNFARAADFGRSRQGIGRSQQR